MEERIKDTYAIEKDTLLPEEYIQLREDAGWGSPDKNDAEEALGKSLAVFVKRQNGIIAGSVRIVGDDKLCFYIQDLIVLKKMRKQGIATKLMSKAMQYINEKAAPNAFIGLMAAKGIDGFYEKFGFIKRPNEQMGPGMIMFHGRPGQLSEE